MPALMPVGIRQFTDANGKPLVGGWVAYAQSGTGGATLRNVYADEGETTLLQNPVPLDASGRPYSGGSQVSIWGDGVYEEYVYDRNGVLQTTSTIDTQSSAAATLAATGSGERIGRAAEANVFRQQQGLGMPLAIIKGGMGATDNEGRGEVEFDRPFTSLISIACTHYDPKGHADHLPPITISDYSASGFKVRTHHSHTFFWMAMGAP